MIVCGVEGMVVAKDKDCFGPWCSFKGTLIIIL